MQVAVTNHAVERYKQRVPKADKLDNEAIRQVIRERVDEAFDQGTVRPHPGNHPDRRMIAFTVGQENVYLALGPNITDVPGEWAVIGLLFDREVGQKGIGSTIGDIVPEELKQKLAEVAATPRTVKYLVRIGGTGSKEVYEASDNDALKNLLARRQPKPDEVEIFERRDLVVRTEYVIEPRR